MRSDLESDLYLLRLPNRTCSNLLLKPGLMSSHRQHLSVPRKPNTQNVSHMSNIKNCSSLRAEKGNQYHYTCQIKIFTDAICRYLQQKNVITHQKPCTYSEDIFYRTYILLITKLRIPVRNECSFQPLRSFLTSISTTKKYIFYTHIKCSSMSEIIIFTFL